MTISTKTKKKCPEPLREIGLVPLPEEVLLQIHADERPLSRLSCSPFGQRELVLGWLFCQGLIEGPDDVRAMEIKNDQAFVNLRAAAGNRLRQDPPLQVTACSGGDVHPGLFENPPVSSGKCTLTLAQAIGLMEQLPARAKMFRRHGGIHCSLLAHMKEKSILASREDIGRSNSVDKVIGWGLGAGIDFSGTALLTTGRISAEMTLKVLRAGIPVLISQTTLTSKALEIVRRSGLTMIGHVLKPQPILLNF